MRIIFVIIVALQALFTLNACAVKTNIADPAWDRCVYHSITDYELEACDRAYGKGI